MEEIAIYEHFWLKKEGIVWDEGVQVLKQEDSNHTDWNNVKGVVMSFKSGGSSNYIAWHRTTEKVVFLTRL